MNREILFRGKRVNNGEWVYGDLIRINNGNDKIAIIPFVMDFGSSCDDYKVLLDTIGQYTGLKDKNGKKIFEGDIIKTPRGFIGEVIFGRAEEECTHRECNRKITDVYTTYGWIFKRADGYTCAIDDEILQGELLGNVTDNPELIK